MTRDNINGNGADATGAGEIEFSVTITEANVILEALGNLPFARVFELVGKLQEQARVQIDGDAVSAHAPGDGDASAAER